MKKYIAPEMEISKFAAEDIITTSVTEPVIKYDENYANYDGFSQNAKYGTF